MEKCQEAYKFVQSIEYENWIIEFLERQNFICDDEDLYLYSRPENMTDADIKNACMLSYYWDYIIVEELNKTESSDTSWDVESLLKIEPDKEEIVTIRDKKYKFSRIAGCGTYIYALKTIN